MAAGHDVLVHQDHGGTLPGMGSIELSVDVAADARTTWAVLADVGHHHRWMEDAVSIRFEGEQRQGEGTVFFADTRVGPLRTTDRMIITAWTDEREMSVHALAWLRSHAAKGRLVLLGDPGWYAHFGFEPAASR